MLVAVGRDGRDLRDLLRCRHLALVSLQILDHSVHSGLATAAQVHGVAASSHILHTFGVDSASQHRGGRRTVTSYLIGLAGHVLHEASTQVLVLVLEFNSTCHRDAVFRDLGTTEWLLDDHIAALGA